jgi:transcriptional regulator with PAS, ATPase and Fis domain
LRHFRFHISLYVIIPFIFAGFSIFSSLLTFRVTKYSIEQKAEPTTWVFWLILAISILSFTAGFSLVRFLLRPVELFVEKASKLPAFSADPPTKSKKDWSVDKIEQFTSVFDRVTSVLSRIEARHFFPEIIGESTSIRGLLSLIMKVAPTDSTVLILGESGTGKEMVATSIFKQSHRKDKPFVKLNCAAIPEELLESELFGHEKGAFTGATAFKPGKFDMAHGGTIFLDEIGDMPHNLQAKILRVLQEKEFYRVGGSHTIKVDVRFLASTNMNLERMVQEGTFREDLYYRLNVFTLHLPPLRERKEDIPVLADHFLKKLPKPVEISSVSLQMLMAYSWPGNIRELKNVIESAAVIAEVGFIEPAQLPGKITGLFAKPSSREGNDFKLPTSISLDEKLKEIERSLIIEALTKTGGVQSRATELLGINQRSLWHRIKKLNIDVKSIKNYEV